MLIIRIANKLVKTYGLWNYHERHKKKAHQILKKIETSTGKVPQEIIKKSNEYATEVLGWKGYAPWLYVYAAFSGQFKEGWIPDNYYGKTVVPIIKGGYGEVDNIKPIARKILSTELLPDIAYYGNGLWISKTDQFIPKGNLKDFVFSSTEKFVFKQDNSEQGKGVFVFDSSSFDLKKIEKLGNGVIQKFIHQHDFFDEFMPNSVANIRVTTVFEDSGQVSVRGCYLRIGRTNDTHVKSDSNLRIPIEISSGEFSEFGYDADWLKIKSHPDTKVTFQHKQIPNFDKVIAAAKALHQSFPYAKCVGWDFILNNQNEVELMEWNGTHNGIKFHEASQGPCFSDLGWENLWRISKNKNI